MFTFFSSPAYGQLPFTPGFPQGFKGPFLAGSKPYYFSEDFGVIVVQELASGQFTLQFYFFHFLKKITLVRLLPQGLHSFFVRKGEAVWREQKKIRLREGQFLLGAGKSRELTIDLAREKSIELFQASFEQNLTEELLPAFPAFEALLLPATKNIYIGPHFATAEIRDAVHQILFAAYEPYLLPFFFKAKVSEYLFLLLHRASHTAVESTLSPTEWETEALFRVRDLILADLQQHYSITELARRFKINPLHLKVFFKRQFGVGPYGFLLNARLDKVKELMEGGMPMKQAAPLAGYRITSFITAFKRRFGYPPGVIFRKKGKE